MTEMKAHPVAELFPMLGQNSDHYLMLVASIQRNGLFHPIVLDEEGRILDGRNRLRACKAAGVEPRFVKFCDLDLGENEEGQPVSEAEFAFEQNLARRDLTDDQRTAIYASFNAFIEGSAPGGKPGNTNAARTEKTIATNSSQSFSPDPTPKKRAPETRKKLAEKAGVSEHKAQQALNVARKASPEVNAAVRAGEMSLKDAVKTVAPAKPKPKPISVDRLDSDDDYLKEIESLACKERVGIEERAARFTENKRADLFKVLAEQLMDLSCAQRKLGKPKGNSQ